MHSHTQISIATTSKEISFNPLIKQSANHHRPSTSSKQSHAGTIGNEHADALAKKLADIYSNIDNTSIRTASPEGNPFYNIHWLTKENSSVCVSNCKSYGNPDEVRLHHYICLKGHFLRRKFGKSLKLYLVNKSNRSQRKHETDVVEEKSVSLMVIQIKICQRFVQSLQIVPIVPTRIT